MKKESFPFDGIGISISGLTKISENDAINMFVSDSEYQNFGCKKPDDDAPVIGVLMAKDLGYQYLQRDYLIALARAGAKVLLLNERSYKKQLELCDGILLPGGYLKAPEWYYTDAKSENTGKYHERCEAYVRCLKYALYADIPVLGICSGMQIIAAEAGLKLFRSPEYIETPLNHKSDESTAHYIDLAEGTPFREMMGDAWRLPVNSRHLEFVAPVRVQRELLGLSADEKLPLEVYALATDGIPEAIGNMEKGILGVQWHPENLAAEGDEAQKKIFKWLVDSARH